ncbi:Aquaporin-10, partial [Xenoophorus captivus]
AIQKYSGGQLTVTGPTATAGIFCTFPAEYLSLWGGIMDQVRLLLSFMNISMIILIICSNTAAIFYK